MPDADAALIRHAVAVDADALADLGARSFVAKFGALYSARDLADFLGKSHVAETVLREIADPAMRVMLAEGPDGRLLGFCKLVMACGWPEHARGENVVELKQLYADPAAIGRGIGGRLMDWALAEARAFGADEMQMSVYSENFDAHRFYARHGCAKVGDIHFMVGAQRDEEFLFAVML